MLNEYLSDEAVSKLQEAFYHESTNALIYRTLAIWLNSKGLINLSDYYEKWALEEMDHQKWVKEFMMSLDVPIIGGNSFAENYNLENSLDEFVFVTVNREKLTTQLYRDISIIALDMEEAGSAMLLEFAQKMSREQAEETDKALTLQSRIKNLNNNFAFAQIFDNSFGG